MNLPTLGKALLGAVAVSVLAIGAADARTLKIQTSATASHFSLAFLNAHWLPALKEATGGSVELELLPTKSVVPHKETPQAVAMGILDGDLTATSYFSGLDPAFALMGDLIAGYDTPQQLVDFCDNGGGKELLQKLFDKYAPGVHVISCYAYGREAFVSKVPIHGVDDLKGLKLRAPEGLAADVFKRAGATPVSLPSSEVYTALEKGIIDAADNSTYSNNDANGMHKVAKFPLYPGIHSMPILQFTMNQGVWDSLTDKERSAIVSTYHDAVTGVTAASDAEDKKLVERDKAAGDLTIIDWPQDERNKLRAIAEEAWKAFAASSDLAKEVYEAHVKYMKAHGLL